MKFVGEHLFPGQLGHFFVLFSFVAAFIAALGFYRSFRATDPLEKVRWLKTARILFFSQFLGVLIVFGTIFYICSHHLYEYMYAYKHASKELEYKYLLACIWEGQEGSFLLWTIWQCVLGSILIRRSREWEAPVMTVISFAQFFLLMMNVGIYFGNIKLGNSPFTLTRNEIPAPIFSQPDYLHFLKDGMGLNVLLRNYWMVIHPPILFLGFASTIVPFAYAIAALLNKKYNDWIKPVLPWLLMSACILGVGIMMGGKWAYESLNFGGYWAWDPVENASLVPWLLLIAGLHTMVVFKATGHSLRASFLFAILAYLFILYATFLTRTGILGDTSVHAFTETGDSINFTVFGHLFSFKAMNALILSYLMVFAIPGLVLLARNFRRIPALAKEEEMNSREFWMFIGSLVLFLTAIFISAKTSVPVVNKLFGTRIAPPEDVEFSYNKVVILMALIIGLLTATTQFLRYRTTARPVFLKKIVWPTAIAAAITALIGIFYPFSFYQHGAGFLAAIYVTAFATIYAAVANGWYLFTVQKGKFLRAGGSIAHLGFAVMLVGILISSANKKVISSSGSNGIVVQTGKDPMTKKDDNAGENLTLLREVPATLADYHVTYLNDSNGVESNRKFYHLDFVKKDAGGHTVEHFMLQPDVYLMKDNNMSSNPDTKSYFFKDVFTYITAALNKEDAPDTAKFSESLMVPGDTVFYSNGFIVLTGVEKDPAIRNFSRAPGQIALAADLMITAKDSMHYHGHPAIVVDSLGILNVDDTVYAQNLFLRFIGVNANKQLRIGIRESDRMIDYVTVKAYVFPMINLVWLGLVIMAVGLIVSMLQRARFGRSQSLLILLAATGFIFYMFLLASG